MVKKLNLGMQMESDLKNVKSIFGLDKKKSYKQRYEERLREKRKEQEEAEYKAKLEELDADRSRADRIKDKLKKLLE